MAGSGLKGPGDLLADLEAYDAVRYPNIRPPLSNLALGRRGLFELITAAYKVSMRREEGRYPRFVIFVPPATERLDEHTAIRFQPPIAVDPDVLHRLGAGIPHRPYALLVRGGDAGPVAEGVLRTERTGVELLPTIRYAAGTVVSGGLYLSIDGPGDLTAIDFSGSLHKILNLRAGEIRAAWDATAAGISRVVFANLERSVRELAEGTRGASNHHRLTRTGEMLPRLVRGAWGYILQRAIELAHGGTFVILPPRLGLAEVESMLTVPFRTGGTRDIAAYLCQLLFPAGSDEDAIRRLQDVAHAIEDQARTIAQVSAVDGCVVVSHRLGLLGFSGEIRVADERDVPDCAELDPMAQGLRAIGSFDLRQHGTRHRSAARLCQQVPGVFSYVVSQDGNIRAFTRLTDGRVGVCGPLRLLVGSSAFV